jgi:hypothetical protein
VPHLELKGLSPEQERAASAKLRTSSFWYQQSPRIRQENTNRAASVMAIMTDRPTQSRAESNWGIVRKGSMTKSPSVANIDLNRLRLESSASAKLSDDLKEVEKMIDDAKHSRAVLMGDEIRKDKDKSAKDDDSVKGNSSRVKKTFNQRPAEDLVHTSERLKQQFKGKKGIATNIYEQIMQDYASGKRKLSDDPDDLPVRHPRRPASQTTIIRRNISSAGGLTSSRLEAKNAARFAREWQHVGEVGAKAEYRSSLTQFRRIQRVESAHNTPREYFPSIYLNIKREKAIMAEIEVEMTRCRDWWIAMRCASSLLTWQNGLENARAARAELQRRIAASLRIQKAWRLHLWKQRLLFRHLARARLSKRLGPLMVERYRLRKRKQQLPILLGFLKYLRLKRNVLQHLRAYAASVRVLQRFFRSCRFKLTTHVAILVEQFESHVEKDRLVYKKALAKYEKAQNAATSKPSKKGGKKNGGGINGLLQPEPPIEPPVINNAVRDKAIRADYMRRKRAYARQWRQWSEAQQQHPSETRRPHFIMLMSEEECGTMVEQCVAIQREADEAKALAQAEMSKW